VRETDPAPSSGIQKTLTEANIQDGFVNQRLMANGRRMIEAMITGGGSAAKLAALADQADLWKATAEAASMRAARRITGPSPLPGSSSIGTMRIPWTRRSSGVDREVATRSSAWTRRGDADKANFYDLIDQ